MADKSFGRVIEGRRRELGLTQETVAKKVGVRANYVGYLERGMRHPSQRVVEKLSTALKLNAQDLYLLANPRVRSLLGKAKPAAPSVSPWQQFIRSASLQQKNGLSKAERDALAQIARAEKATSMAGVIKAVRALRKGFRAERPGQRVGR